MVGQVTAVLVPYDRACCGVALGGWCGCTCVPRHEDQLSQGTQACHHRQTAEGCRCQPPQTVHPLPSTVCAASVAYSQCVQPPLQMKVLQGQALLHTLGCVQPLVHAQIRPKAADPATVTAYRRAAALLHVLLASKHMHACTQAGPQPHHHQQAHASAKAQNPPMGEWPPHGR